MSEWSKGFALGILPVLGFIVALMMGVLIEKSATRDEIRRICVEGVNTVECYQLVLGGFNAN